MPDDWNRHKANFLIGAVSQRDDIEDFSTFPLRGVGAALVSMEKTFQVTRHKGEIIVDGFVVPDDLDTTTFKGVLVPFSREELMQRGDGYSEEGVARLHIRVKQPNYPDLEIGDEIVDLDNNRWSITAENSYYGYANVKIFEVTRVT